MTIRTPAKCIIALCLLLLLISVCIVRFPAAHAAATTQMTCPQYTQIRTQNGFIADATYNTCDIVNGKRTYVVLQIDVWPANGAFNPAWFDHYQTDVAWVGTGCPSANMGATTHNTALIHPGNYVVVYISNDHCATPWFQGTTVSIYLP